MDQNGNKVSLNEITAVREMYRKMPNKKVSAIAGLESSLHELRALKTRKQKAEHALMVYLDQRKERQAGNMFLKAVKNHRLLESTNKKEKENGCETKIKSVIQNSSEIKNKSVIQNNSESMIKSEIKINSESKINSKEVESLSTLLATHPHIISRQQSIHDGASEQWSLALARAWAKRSESQKSQLKENSNDVLRPVETTIDYFKVKDNDEGNNKPPSELDVRIQKRVNEAHKAFLKSKNMNK
jgi:hypothetical protein